MNMVLPWIQLLRNHWDLFLLKTQTVIINNTATSFVTSTSSAIPFIRGTITVIQISFFKPAPSVSTAELICIHLSVCFRVWIHSWSMTSSLCSRISQAVYARLHTHKHTSTIRYDQHSCTHSHSNAAPRAKTITYFKSTGELGQCKKYILP